MLKAPPPVAARPKCPNCDKPLRPLIHREQERRPSGIEGGFTYVTVSATWSGRYHAYGAFCTLRCCAEFANACALRGYRPRR